MPEANNDIDYSIVICTYNPDERLLRRCLQAVKNLNTDGLTTEVIVVDNNSAVAVKSLSYVKEYAEEIPSMKIIFVPEQGVKYARMAAIERAKGKFIVYLDYDNEAETDYLQELKKLNAAYPNVAAWGPGNVWVDFIDGIDKNIESYAQGAFQERHEKKILFDNQQEWQSCYPFGTGLCTSALLLKEYVAWAKEGKFTLPGRKGAQLSSGEDTQMVMLCIKKGFAAGVSPALKIKHIITGNRANYKYLQRLTFGTGLCYETCLIQVFPENKNALQKKLIPESKFARQTIKKLLKAKFSSNRNNLFNVIQFIASKAGVYLALNKPIPSTIIRIVKYLKLE